MQSATPVAEFSVAAVSRFSLRGSKLSRTWFNVDGSVPIADARDVANADQGAKPQSTGDIASFLTAAYSYRTYNGRNVATYGVTARATGRLTAPELVAQAQPLAGFLDPDGRSFAGLSLESGVRNGDAEWRGLTRRASDQGNFVLRGGAVLEYAPLLGPVNRDLGRGLRFFVRGRGWVDRAEDGARVRGFGDSEVFFNLSSGASGTQSRVYVRYELGYLPPDFSRRRDGLSVGYGAAF